MWVGWKNRMRYNESMDNNHFFTELPVADLQVRHYWTVIAILGNLAVVIIACSLLNCFGNTNVSAVLKRKRWSAARMEHRHVRSKRSPLVRVFCGKLFPLGPNSGLGATRCGSSTTTSLDPLRDAHPSRRWHTFVILPYSGKLEPSKHEAQGTAYQRANTLV